MRVPLVVLIILDGWGIAPVGPGNAIAATKTPNMTRLVSSFPHTTLIASGEAVGLPRGEPGNTETGHLNLGAGRIIYQDLVRINNAISNGTFFRNEVLIAAIAHVQRNKSKLHIMGLLGAGGVHSSKEHLFALLRLCREQNYPNAYLHIFTDGRDSPPKAGVEYLTQLEDVMKLEGVGQIASVMGRYWAMDRDLRWDRTGKAYLALTAGSGVQAVSAGEAIEAAYEAGVTDEFIEPCLVTRDGKPIKVEEGDAVIFFNFRVDRPRQLTAAFVFDDLEKEAEKITFDFDPYAHRYPKQQPVAGRGVPTFSRPAKVKNLFFATMTEYAKSIDPYVKVAFPPVIVPLPLGAVVAAHNLRQLRLAESEKERFVTFYFNGQREIIFPGETHKIALSPKVPTYDSAPEMAAGTITKNFSDLVGSGNPGQYALVLVNFANPDMVGHTGNLEATKIACSTVDACVGKIVSAVDNLGGVTLVTSDHGNAEELLTPDGQPDTEHNTNPVPFIVVGKQFLGKAAILQSGILADVAPTILKIMGLAQPTEMTGRSLI